MMTLTILMVFVIAENEKFLPFGGDGKARGFIGDKRDRREFGDEGLML